MNSETDFWEPDALPTTYELEIAANGHNQHICERVEDGTYVERYVLTPTMGTYRGTWRVGQEGYVEGVEQGQRGVRRYFRIEWDGVRWS